MFHLSNVFYHFLTVILFYRLLIKLTTVNRAVLFSLIFLIHPINVHAVSWISGRNDILLAVALLVLLHSVNLVVKNSGIISLLLPILPLFVAFFIKESAILFPVIAVLFFFFLTRRDTHSLKVKLLIVAFIFTSGLAMGIRAMITTSGSIPHINTGYSLKMLFEIFQALLIYFGKLFIPYNYSVLPSISDSSLLPGILSLIFFLGVSLYFNIFNNKLYRLGIIWSFLFAILPTIWTVYTGMGNLYEHRMYIPLMGILLSLTQIDFHRLPELFKKIKQGLIISGLSILFTISLIRSTYYKSSEVFTERAVIESPGLYRSYTLRGTVYYNNGDYDSAISDFSRALDLNPRLYKIYNVRGTLQLYFGKYREAIEDFTECISLNPAFSEGYYNRSIALIELQNYENAIIDLSNAIILNPNRFEYYNNRGFVYEKLGDYAKALNDYYNAMQLNPDNSIISENILKIQQKLMETVDEE